MDTDQLQSYARCDECLEILWIEQSVFNQKCGCRCGNLELCNSTIDGIVDPTFTKEDMNSILASESI